MVAIITALVALKSLASLVFGLLTIFWLPAASLIVPTIIAAEDPDDADDNGWLTAATVALAAGFAMAAGRREALGLANRGARTPA